LDAKANQSTTYTKGDVDTALALKANQSTTYTKTDVDSKISNLIANAPDALNTLNELAQALANDPSYATTVVNQLAQKADKSTTYTKTEVDSALSAKANQLTTYTKTEVDSALSAKAHQLTTYTKTEVDSALSAKQDAINILNILFIIISSSIPHHRCHLHLCRWWRGKRTKSGGRR
jgi:hypothetical protein